MKKLSLTKSALLFALLLFVIDQISKNLVVVYMYEGQKELLPFLNLTHVWNRGVSFGLFNNDHSAAWLLIALSLVITTFFLHWLRKVDHKKLALAIGAVIGGALGNVIDRIRFDAVVDFIDFHIGNWHYPAFNVADSAIVLGIAYIVLDSLFFEPKRNKADQHEQKI